MVTSGGCDITVNVDLFDFNHDALNHYGIKDNIVVEKDTETIKINRPIIVTIPEASLYDLKGTLIKLAHEFFHKRAERLREKRAKYYFKSLCDVFSSNIEYYVVSYFLRKKAQYIFENRFYTGDFRNVYGYGNKEAFQSWLIDLDRYISRYKINSEELSPNNQESLDYIEKLTKLFQNQAFNFSKYCTSNPSRIFELNEVFFNTAKELEDCYKDYKRANGVTYACKKLKKHIYEAISNSNGLIAVRPEIENWDYLYSYNVYKRCINYFKVLLTNDEVKADVETEIQKFANTVYKSFCNGSGPFVNISILAREDNNHIGKRVWKNFVEDIQREGNIISPLLNLTLLSEWSKDVKPIYELYAILFKECYADFMALKALGSVLGNSIEGFLQYIFVTVFEIRNINELFHRDKNAYSVNENANIDLALFLRYGIIAEIFWPHIVEDFKEKKEEIIKAIKTYYKDVKLGNLDDAYVEVYAESLFNILKEMFNHLKKYDIDMGYQYSRNLKEYLEDCGNIKSNQILIEEIHNRAEDIAKTRLIADNLNDLYVDFIMKNWLELYGNK